MNKTSGNTFPFKEARLFLIQAVSQWLPREQAKFSEKIVDLHLAPENFPMPINTEKAVLIEMLNANASPSQLRSSISFENTKTIHGIVRVMVRTHLNRSGISYVTRGAKNRTLSWRVLGMFSDGFDPNQYISWEGLIKEWHSFANKCFDNRLKDDNNNDLFNRTDIDSLMCLSSLNDNQYREAKTCPGVHNNWAKLLMGIHSGMKFLNDRYNLDANSIWDEIENASQSASTVKKLTKITSKSIDEYGETLAGSFFADLGASRFVKDDIHVIDSIASFTRSEKSSVSGNLSFDLMQRSADHHGVSPRAIDKVMFLACSTNLYLFNFKLDKHTQQVEKKKFCEFLKYHIH